MKIPRIDWRLYTPEVKWWYWCWNQSKIFRKNRRYWKFVASVTIVCHRQNTNVWLQKICFYSFFYSFFFRSAFSYSRSGCEWAGEPDDWDVMYAPVQFPARYLTNFFFPFYNYLKTERDNIFLNQKNLTVLEYSSTMHKKRDLCRYSYVGNIRNYLHSTERCNIQIMVYCTVVIQYLQTLFFAKTTLKYNFWIHCTCKCTVSYKI